MDRLSTGSRESTQSEWLPGEKKKSKGLLGKLKKIGRSLSTERTNEAGAEREFGSGSDISSVSQVVMQRICSLLEEEFGSGSDISSVSQVDLWMQTIISSFPTQGSGYLASRSNSLAQAPILEGCIR